MFFESNPYCVSLPHPTETMANPVFTAGNMPNQTTLNISVSVSERVILFPNDCRTNLQITYQKVSYHISTLSLPFCQCPVHTNIKQNRLHTDVGNIASSLNVDLSDDRKKQ